jgi:hypothetical protein
MYEHGRPSSPNTGNNGASFVDRKFAPEAHLPSAELWSLNAVAEWYTCGLPERYFE